MPDRRVADPEKLQRLLSAVMLVEGELSLPTLLRQLVEEAAALVDARYAAMGVLDASGQRLDQFVTTGLTPEEEHRIGPRPTGRGVLGLLITEPTPLRLRSLSDHPASFGIPAHHPRMVSFLGVPVRFRGAVVGNLYLTDKRSAEEFNAEDEELAVALAAAAGIAIDNARLHDRLRQATLLEDRDRIARDLHDSVIQRLFATGLLLQGALRGADDSTAERIARAVDELDTTIRIIRTTIFELEGDADQAGLRRQVLDVVGELAGVIGVEPVVEFSGPVDTGVPQELADHLVAVLREALTNVGKHAGATDVRIGITAGTDLVLTVADNGVGIDDALLAAGGHGIRNLRHRAERHGGTLDLDSTEGGGTTLIWTVPLADAG